MEGRKQPLTARSSLVPPAPTYEGPTEPHAMGAGALCSPTYGCKMSHRAQDLHGPMLWVQDPGQPPVPKGPPWPHIPRTIPLPKHPWERGRGTRGRGGLTLISCSMPGMGNRDTTSSPAAGSGGREGGSAGPSLPFQPFLVPTAGRKPAPPPLPIPDCHCMHGAPVFPNPCAEPDPTFPSPSP